MVNRRQILRAIAAAAAGTPALGRGAADRFGPLQADSEGILDLPAGFSYRVIARAGEDMDDGLLVPPRADGMGAFAAPGGNVILVCNHENHPSVAGAFGNDNDRLDRIDRHRLYDAGGGQTPGTGGTTTLVYNPATGERLQHFLSLGGTEINCAGGITPWRSWLSCEECFTDPGASHERGQRIQRDERHGFVFEVPADADRLVEAVPIREMGRFEHEAAAIDPATGFVYLSEDRRRSLLYRFLPEVPGTLSAGGKLQALAVAGQDTFDTRNWSFSKSMPVDRWFDVHWITLTEPDSADNDLRFRGADAGAALFARGEGLAFADGSLFLTATIGGPDGLGQVFEVRPGRVLDGREQPGRLRLIAQSAIGGMLRNADNLSMSPWGDLVICEDTASGCGLVGLTPSGDHYRLANNAYTDSELAGVCFAPDGRTLFVNIQDRGLTLAIRGPWQA